MAYEIWKKIYSAEQETPFIFWLTYVVYLTILIFFVYYAQKLQSHAVWILIGITIVTGVLFPAIYLYKRWKKIK